MTMEVVSATQRGYRCLVKDAKAKGKKKTEGVIQHFDRQDVIGDRAFWVKVPDATDEQG